MRVLHFINLAGVLALGVLCIAQWQDNRQFNQEINRLEAIRIDHSEKLARQTTDLDSLRSHLTRLTGEVKETEGKLTLSQREASQLGIERDQLKQSVKTWADAVNARDEQIKAANEQIRELGENLNQATTKFNELATNYNGLVTQLNERTAAYNELVAKYNALAKK